MLRCYLTLICLLVSFKTVISQRLKAEDVNTLSKQHLLKAVGPDLMTYFKSTNDISYYTLPKNRYGYEKSKLLKRNKRIRKKWTYIYIFWHFKYPEIEGIRSGFWVKFDKELKLIEPINLDFIPPFLWNKEPSNFISKKEATQIGNQHLSMYKLERSAPKLTFDRRRKKYIYTLTNRLPNSANSWGLEYSCLEILVLSAVSGEVYSHVVIQQRMKHP